MRVERKAWLKKHWGVLWSAAVVLTFSAVYFLSFIIMNVCGASVDSANTFSMELSSAVTIAVYIICAVWGILKL